MRILVICNAYPSEGNLYRNGFIHRRVKGYQSMGISVSVFYNHQPITHPYTYYFDGVQVRVGNDEALEQFVRDSRFDACLVHFAEPSRVLPLERANVDCPVIIWIHGFEAEAWHRRWFNFVDGPESAAALLAKRDSYYKAQNSFMHRLGAESNLDITMVNVSRWFRDMVVEPDNDLDLAGSPVIPNFVDGDIFRFNAKKPEHRFRILSIRPFASRKYANDVTVGAILELSKRPFFERLTFTLCGDGDLFAETVKPIKNMKNVKLIRKFQTQQAISKLHQEHGVFLAPTRFDSQGVSMCEAMSSGMVPVSTEIAAIPEFVEQRASGLLASPESSLEIADLIEELYFDPELFLKLSESASTSIQRKCGWNATIGEEIALIKNLVRHHEAG